PDFAQMLGRAPSQDADRVSKLADVVEATARDVDVILDHNAKEFAYHVAFRQELDYLVRLEAQHDRALQRRKDALEQLDRYQEGLGAIAHRLSDELIEGEYVEVDATEAPLAPAEKH